MSARSRTALRFALALGLVAAAQPARAQEGSLAAPAAPAPAVTAPAVQPAAPAAVPTMDAAAVGVRHQADTEAAAPRRGGSAPGTALMIVGGAAILVGLVIGGDAGAAIAVGGAVAGLVGLYQYLQ